MRGISGRHFYRFKYLKSDHWQNLRLEKLVEVAILQMMFTTSIIVVFSTLPWMI